MARPTDFGPGPLSGEAATGAPDAGERGAQHGVRHEEGTFPGAGGVELFRQAWLPAAGDPVATLINLHGLGDHSGLYPAVVEHFTGRGWAVHAFDLRGNGRSPGRRGHVDSWADYREDLDRFLRRTREHAPAPVFLMGTSLGGLIVLDYALEHPDHLAGVVAVSPPLGRLAVPPWLLALGGLLSRIWPTFSHETGLDVSGLSRDPAAAQAVRGDPLFHRRATARLATETLATIQRVRSRVRELRVPVLVVHGGADRMVPPNGSRAFAASADPNLVTYREYPDAYHALFADLDQARVLRDVEAWIADKARRGWRRG